MRDGERARRTHHEVVQLVSERTGLTFPPDQIRKIERRIRQILARYAPETVADYLTSAAPDHPLLDALVEELTVGETYFFREPAQFDHIRSAVLPELMQRAETGRAIRAWSAGCASGEEAYSLAILLGESAGTVPWTVIGTDLSRERLRRAQLAEYSRWALRTMSDDWAEAYFTRRGNRYLLRPQIRERVTYRPLNLAGTEYPSVLSGVWEMDLILCRNVLIYLDPASVGRVASRLLDSLSAAGWLFLGASDPMLSDFVACETVITEAGIAYRRRTRRTVEKLPTAREGAPVQPRRATLPKQTTPPAADTMVGPGPLEAAEACYAARNYEEAAKLLQTCLHRQQGGAQQWTLLVRALANQGRLIEAARACVTAIEKHPTHASLSCLHAVVLGAAGRHEESASAARRALYLERKMVMAHLTLGQSQLRLGDRGGAKRSFLTTQSLLTAMDADAIVPDSDGETVARLLRIVAVQLKLLNGSQ